MTTDNLPPSGIDRLLAIMAALRDPETGCPWDIAQSFATIAPYTLEEAHEPFISSAYEAIRFRTGMIGNPCRGERRSLIKSQNTRGRNR